MLCRMIAADLSKGENFTEPQLFERVVNESELRLQLVELRLQLMGWSCFVSKEGFRPNLPATFKLWIVPEKQLFGSPSLWATRWAFHSWRGPRRRTAAYCAGRRNPWTRRKLSSSPGETVHCRSPQPYQGACWCGWCRPMRPGIVQSPWPRSSPAIWSRSGRTPTARSKQISTD